MQSSRAGSMVEARGIYLYARLSNAVPAEMIEEFGPGARRPWTLQRSV
ncbi:hypothetical protein BH24ACT19_BH24ACT19_16360 [soil metagenome]